MFSNNFTSSQIRASARRELAGCDEALTAQLRSWISVVFEKWKLERGDRNPRQANRGLLSDLIEKPIPFENAHPWECAGLLDPSRIGLAIKLMNDEYAHFEAIFDKVPLRKVLALLIADESDAATEEELFSAYGLLVELQKMHSEMIGTIETLKDLAPAIQAYEQQKLAMAKGRVDAVKVRKESAQQKHELVDKAIDSLFSTPEKPGWGCTDPQIVEYLQPRNFPGKTSSLKQRVKRIAAGHRKARKERQASQYLNR